MYASLDENLIDICSLIAVISHSPSCYSHPKLFIRDNHSLKYFCRTYIYMSAIQGYQAAPLQGWMSWIQNRRPKNSFKRKLKQLGFACELSISCYIASSRTPPNAFDEGRSGSCFDMAKRWPSKCSNFWNIFFYCPSSGVAEAHAGVLDWIHLHSLIAEMQLDTSLPV